MNTRIVRASVAAAALGVAMKPDLSTIFVAAVVAADQRREGRHAENIAAEGDDGGERLGHEAAPPVRGEEVEGELSPGPVVGGEARLEAAEADEEAIRAATKRPQAALVGALDVLNATARGYAWTADGLTFALWDRRGCVASTGAARLHLRGDADLARATLTAVEVGVSDDWSRRSVEVVGADGRWTFVAEESPAPAVDPTYDGIDLMVDLGRLIAVGRALAQALALPLRAPTRSSGPLHPPRARLVGLRVARRDIPADPRVTTAAMFHAAFVDERRARTGRVATTATGSRARTRARTAHPRPADAPEGGPLRVLLRRQAVDGCVIVSRRGEAWSGSRRFFRRRSHRRSRALR